jgi:methionyl-tRNA formyltransferase
VTRVVLFSYGPVIGPLRALFAELGAELIAVVLPSNRSDAAVADARAAAAGLQILVQPPRADAGTFARSLAALDVDLIVVWHYSMLVPPEVLRVPSRGTVNVHGGLLPDYRGGHVLQWAIVNGEPETGATLHYVDETIDTGPVIAEARVAVDDDDDAATVAAKIHDAGLELLRAHWRELESGTAVAQAQEPGAGRYWPLRTPADGVIDWTQPAVRIRNLVRALVPPWPGATTTVGGATLVVESADLAEGEGEPGTVLAVEIDRVVVAAGEGAVALRGIRWNGKALDPIAFPLAVGGRLGA